MKRLVDVFNYRKAYEELHDVMNLEYNWNGYGAPAGTAYPYEMAVPFLKLLETNRMPVPYITATGNRTIQLEWEKGNHYLEIELYDDHVSVIRATLGKHVKVFYDRNYSYKEGSKLLEQVRRWDQELPFLR